MITVIGVLYLASFAAALVAATMMGAMTEAQPSKKPILFSMVLVAMWAMGDFLSSVAIDSNSMRLVSVVFIPFWALVPPFCMYASLAYVGMVRIRTNPLFILALFTPAAGVMALEWNGSLHHTFLPSSHNGLFFESLATPWQHAVSAYFLMTFVLAGLILYRASHRSDQAQIRTALRLVALVLVPAALAASILNGTFNTQSTHLPHLASVIGCATVVLTCWLMVGRGVFAPLSRLKAQADAALERSESEKLHLVDQAQQSQKLGSLGLLAGGLAHDFNNLLVGVLGNASLALDELPAEAPVRKRIDQIARAGEQAARLVREMLAYAGRGSFCIETIDLAGLVSNMSELLRSSISKKISLHTLVDSATPAIEADSAQVQQVIMNLITNASEAIGDRPGEIWLRLERCQVEASQVVDRQGGGPLAPGRYTCLEVEDSGTGMDPKTLEHMFDPFFTTKFTGRGLGMAAVAGIVRKHQGAIAIQSTPGQGTQVRVYFPSSQHELPPAKPDPVPGPGARTTAEGIILVVDDESLVREVCQETMQQAGFEVLTAGSGTEGLALFHKQQGKLRLVILDLTMPQMDGRECLQQLRKAHPTIPVLLMSGFDASECLAGLAEDRRVGFLQKPFRANQLLLEVGRMLDSLPTCAPGP